MKFKVWDKWINEWLDTSINPDGTVICENVGGGSGGDITAVYAGLGLTGGGTTGAVTLNLANFGTCPAGQFMTGIANGEIVCSSEAWQSQGWVSITSAQAQTQSRDPSLSCTSAGMVPCEDSGGHAFECYVGANSFNCPSQTNQVFWVWDGGGHWACSSAATCDSWPLINIHCCKP